MIIGTIIKHLLYAEGLYASYLIWSFTNPIREDIISLSQMRKLSVQILLIA